MATDALEQHLSFGRYQLVLMIQLLYSQFCSLGTMYFGTFAGVKPDIVCTNETGYEVVHTRMLDGCRAMADNTSCTNYTLTAHDFYSVAAEWELICEKLSMVYSPTTYQMLGVLVGAPVFGQLSDWVGRRRTQLLTWSATAAIQLASAFVPNWTWYTISRIVLGFVVAGQITTSYVLTCEFLSSRDRFTALSLTGWSICFVPLTVIGYITKDWRQFLICTSVACVPGILLVVFLIDESPRWLLNHGRRDQALHVILNVCKRNKRAVNMNELRDQLEQLCAQHSHSQAHPHVEHNGLPVKKKTAKPKKYAFYHLCYTRKLALYSVSLGWTWFTASAASYSIGFNVGNLAANFYVNILLMNVISYACELITIASARVFHRWLGRKPILVLQLLIVLGMYAAICVFTALDAVSYAQLIRFAYLIACGVLAPAWIMIYLLAGELYPTPVRNIANGSMSLCARIGGALAPQIVFLGDHNPFISAAIMTAFVLVSVILVVAFIDETKDRALPDKMPPASERIRCACVHSDEEKHAAVDYA